MKVAVTADLHLTSCKAHPERFHALENILDQMNREKIAHLIIAGDLFDKDDNNFSEFENLCTKTKYRLIHLHIIPGNHDSDLDNRNFSADNITVYTKPELKSFDLISRPVLFLPYRDEKTMGEEIAAFADQLRDIKWMLVGHGDWVQGMREINPYEPGVYMPLTRTDIDIFRPATVLLGHIHKPSNGGMVHYPGSPCPLDINETGKRRFLVLDTENGTLEAKPVTSDVIYFNEDLVVMPLKDEKLYLQNWAREKITEWSLNDADKERAQIRLTLTGYTNDKRALMKIVQECFRGFAFYQNVAPALSGVSVSDDVERTEIVKQVASAIDALNWPHADEQPGKDHILLEAMRVIYGD